MLILTYKFIYFGGFNCKYQIFVVILRQINNNKLLSLWNVI